MSILKKSVNPFYVMLWFVAISSVGFGFVLVLMAKNNPAVSDDFTHIINNSLLKGPVLWTEFWGPSWKNGNFLWGYRPIYHLSFWLETNWLKSTLGGMRLINYLIHLLNIGLLCHLAKKLWKPDYSHSMSLFIVTLLCLHPVTWHSILYASARSTLLVTFFILLTLNLTLVSGLKKVFALVPMFLAFLSKQTGILALPLALFFIYLQSKSSMRNRLKVKEALILLCVAVLCFFVFAHLQWDTLKFLPQKILNLRYAFYHYPTYLMTQTFVTIKYLGMMIYPFDWAFYFYTPLIASAADLKFIIGLATLILLVGILFRFRQHPWAKIFLVALACFGPEFFYPRELVSTEQRIYLPLFLFALGLLNLLVVYQVKLKPLAVVSLLFAFIFGLLSYQRTQIYNDLELMLKHDLSRDPKNVDALMVIGKHYNQKGQTELAFDNLSRALELMRPHSSQNKYIKQNFSKTFYVANVSAMKTNQWDFVTQSLNDCRLGLVDEYHCKITKAEYHLSQKQPIESIQLLNSLAEHQLASLQILIKSYLMKPEFNKALELIELIHRSNLSDPLTFELEIKAHFMKKDQAQALDTCDRAISFFKGTNPQEVFHFEKVKKEILMNAQQN